MRFKATCIGLLMACATLPTNAALYVSDYQRLKEQGSSEPLVYVTGVGEGMFWANLILTDADAPPLYCPPELLALGGENYMSILDRAIRERENKEKDVPVEMLLMFGLMETFPCD